MTQSPITAFRLGRPALPTPVQSGQAWVTSHLRGPSPRGALTPCLGLAALGSTILWATILSVGAFLIA